MRESFRKWFLQTVLLSAYKFLLDFVFLKTYYGVFSYLIEGHYEWNPLKFCLSIGLFFVFMVLNFQSFENTEKDPNILISLFLIICIVPMLSVYAFLSYVTVSSIIYPSVFWIILLICVLCNSRCNSRLRIPSIKHASTVLLIFCILGTAICWAWAGFPLIRSLSISSSTAQRIALRTNNMPTILGYIFMLLGGVLLPFLFARYLDSKKYFSAVIAIFLGYLLFSVNGMKTWLFLYLFVIAVFILCRIFKNNLTLFFSFLPIFICLLLLFCVLIYSRHGSVAFLSLFGRVFCIPSGIGFKSINFFSKSENPFLFLRESILRHFFETPYPGGSDFYMKYGSDITVSSGRSNNGLWGDAFRNFGLLGIVFYPFFISLILSWIQKSVRDKSPRLQIIVIFLMIWNAVNTSFFTWLLTGGVVILLVVNAFLNAEDKIAYSQDN